MKGGAKLRRIGSYLIYLSECLGQGEYGMVCRCVEEKSHKPYAVKIIDKRKIRNNEYLQRSLLLEIDILMAIKSDNVVAVIEVLESDNNYYIIQELCDSDLEHYILQHKAISELRAISLISEIATGFTALVAEGIIHRDLKPANVLMKDGQVKIADFGFSKNNICQNMRNGSFVGTPLYMSPQVLRGEPYSSKCDVWAFGLIFYELLHKTTPWTAFTQAKLLAAIEQQPLKINQKLAPLTIDFLQRSLKLEEAERMSWDEVFEHKIFNGMFEYLREGRRQIENKLKMLMTALRQEIDRRNISVRLLLEALELKDQLTIPQFTRFLTSISPSLRREEILRIFSIMDTDQSGTIEITEIESEMCKHRIELDIKRASTMLLIEEDTPKHAVFRQLFSVLREKGISLSKCFYMYSNGTPSIDFERFTKMMRRIGEFHEKDLFAVFQEIDLDHSNSIEYNEIELAFCQVNNVPANALEKGP